MDAEYDMRQALIKEHPAVADSFVVDAEEWKPRRRDWVPIASKEFKLSSTRNENFGRAIAYAKQYMLPNAEIEAPIERSDGTKTDSTDLLCNSDWKPMETAPVCAAGCRWIRALSAYRCGPPEYIVHFSQREYLDAAIADEMYLGWMPCDYRLHRTKEPTK